MLMPSTMIASLIETLIVIINVMAMKVVVGVIVVIVAIPSSGSDVPSNVGQDNYDDDNIYTIDDYQHPVSEMILYKIHRY